MPIFEYETPNGAVIEVLEDRNTVVPTSWKKLMSSASFSTGSVREETMGDKVKKGYYKKECSGGFRSGFTKKQIKQAWGW